MSDLQLFPLRYQNKWIFIDQNAKTYPLDVDAVLVQEAGENTFFIETATGMGLTDSNLNWLIRPDLALQEKSLFNPKINGGLLSKYSSWFENGLSVGVDVNNKYGFIDKQGKWVIKPEYDSAVRFSEGMASVRKDGLWGAIDANGLLIIGFQYGDQFFFKNGTATVHRKGSKLYGGIIDKTGKMLVEEQFQDNKGLSEGLMPAGRTSKYGYYDTSGKAVFPEIFERASLFENGKAVVSFKGKYGMIDKEGNFIIQPVFDYIGYFVNGIAMAQVGSKSGFIDNTGKLVIAPIFNQADGFGSKGLAKVLVSKLFRNPTENVAIYTNYFHYINQDGNFVHPEKPDFDIISVKQWEQENPELATALGMKVMDGLAEYIYLNETIIRSEIENILSEKELNEKTIETELRPMKFYDLIKVPYFMANFASAIIFGFKCSIYSQIEYPQVWHKFIFLGIFAIFGYYSGKTFAEYQYVEGELFKWKNREGILGGLILLIMGLSYFYKITLYFSAIFTLLDLVLLGVFFLTTGMTLGNIFRRMASELLPSSQKGLQLFVVIILLINFIPAILFSGHNNISRHAILGIGFFAAFPLGIIWIFFSDRKPGKEGATSLWNAFYFGSNSASFTTRSFYKKNYSDREFKKWDEEHTNYTFDGDERNIAASRGGVGVICIFFTNLLITSSPWFIVDLYKQLRYLF